MRNSDKQGKENLAERGPFLVMQNVTKLEYACIHSRVPKTGDPELDAIIREGERRRVAAMAMQGQLSGDYVVEAIVKRDVGEDMSFADIVCENALVYADALIAALEAEDDSE